MAITALQVSAFKTASGDIEITVLYLACVGFLLAALFLWAAWALADVWTGWSKDNVRHEALGRVAIRMVILLVVSIWMFAS